MPRTDAFDDYYRESRDRLLLQVYAFAGDPHTAHGALDDAYVAAAGHWSELAARPERDAWIRARAFQATSRRQKSTKQPWYRRSRDIADDHQRLLTALAGLRPPDRHLVVGRYLAGLSVAAAASEAGLPHRAANASLDASTTRLAAAGVVTSPAEALEQALLDLRSDLPAYVDEDPTHLEAQALRRRRTRQTLTASVVIALAVGIGGVTAAQEPDPPTPDASTDERQSVAASQPTAAPPAPPPPTAPALSSGLLTSASSIRSLDRGRKWAVQAAPKTSSQTAADPCLARRPGATAAPYQERRFTVGRTPAAPTLTQTLAASRTPRDARTAFRALVARLTTCSPGPMRISGMATTRDIGDEAVSVTTRHVDQRGLYERRVVAARTGTVVATWAARSPAGSPPISAGVLLRLLGGSVNTVCPRSAGSCAARPYQQTSRIPPAEPRAAGFLSPVDLPVFEGLTRRWTATQVKATGANRASTRCDRANFADARARWMRSRSYVPGGDNNSLPAIFGMTESVGRFASAKATTAFVRGVVSAVDACSGAPRTVTSGGVDPVRLKRGTGFRWDVSVRTAPGTTVVYRSGLVRVGESVAQVTFTPTGDHDITAAGHVGLLSRAAERLTQLGR